ncbi:Hypp7560 [Branchiostoma lanceolatum]|uniref:Hypp7560 protein n=1 Tax=Branchiostoma lanceolatum TaxID=7740 RepID=A0A8K0EEC0_BRALA|nr:Hypp7560 [Branchiostoma lanceolatum]
MGWGIRCHCCRHAMQGWPRITGRIREALAAANRDDGPGPLDPGQVRAGKTTGEPDMSGVSPESCVREDGNVSPTQR